MKRDNRYQKTEKAILSSLLGIYRSEPYLASLHPSKLAEHSKISLATFYRHYKTVDDIFIFYEKKLTTSFTKNLNRRGRTNAKHALRIALIFICKHHDFFLISFSRGDPRVVRQIFVMLQPKFEKSFGWPEDSDKLFDICFYELYGILKQWSHTAFSEHKLNNVYADVLYLLKSAKTRLERII